MSFFDFIRDLRKGKPDVKKAAKAMKIFGWVCIGGGIWNFIFPLIAPFDETPISLPESYPYVAIIVSLVIGLLCFISARGIKRQVRWGIIAGQMAIILFIIIIGIFAFYMFKRSDFLPPLPSFRIMTIIMMTIVFGQFVLPAYYGIRYLGRLPVKKVDLTKIKFGQDNQQTTESTSDAPKDAEQEMKYKDALLPFGIMGSFIFLMACLMIPMLIVMKYGGMAIMPLVFLPGFLLIFFGPVVYNMSPSPFEKTRTVLSEFTGGGSVFMFNGSWPFFRLLVYEDGIEVRVMLHRFFIPHDKMEDIPEKVGFFGCGILIKSDLPGVPSSMRYATMGTKKVLQAIIESRNKYLNKDAGKDD